MQEALVGSSSSSSSYSYSAPSSNSMGSADEEQNVLDDDKSTDDCVIPCGQILWPVCAVEEDTIVGVDGDRDNARSSSNGNVFEVREFPNECSMHRFNCEWNKSTYNADCRWVGTFTEWHRTVLLWQWQDASTSKSEHPVTSESSKALFLFSFCRFPSGWSGAMFRGLRCECKWCCNIDNDAVGGRWIGPLPILRKPLLHTSANCQFLVIISIHNPHPKALQDTLTRHSLVFIGIFSWRCCDLC